MKCFRRRHIDVVAFKLKAGGDLRICIVCGQSTHSDKFSKDEVKALIAFVKETRARKKAEAAEKRVEAQLASIDEIVKTAERDRIRYPGVRPERSEKIREIIRRNANE